MVVMGWPGAEKGHVLMPDPLTLSCFFTAILSTDGAALPLPGRAQGGKTVHETRRSCECGSLVINMRR